MILQAIISALDLPSNCRVDQRVPKKMLVVNGAPTAADKRRINDGIEEIHWLAALKPNTIGVPEYSDDVREYLEIAVLSVILRPDAKAVRLAELIHRAIPYPLFLILVQGDQTIISLTHKRRAQNEADKYVLDGDCVDVTVSGNASSSAAVTDCSFLKMNCLPTCATFSCAMDCGHRIPFHRAILPLRWKPAPAKPMSTSGRSSS